MGIQKLTHAELRVTDMDSAIDFHAAALGLVEVARDNDRIFFSTGAGESYDLALRRGCTGVSRFAFSVDHGDDLEHFADTFKRHGIEFSRATNNSPGVDQALSFQLPAGHQVELVTLSERLPYVHPGRGASRRLSGIAPIDLDHITLRVGDKVRQTMEFLRIMLGFHSSDIVDLPNGEPMATWMNISGYHHDVAMFGGRPGDTLDHIAWTMDGMDHIKRSLDLLARVGIQTEAGPGRHGVGGNLYAYFWAPGGNRYELSAEMPRTVDRLAPPKRWSDASAGFSAWGARHPESFANGS